jgi:hypothetical protein
MNQFIKLQFKPGVNRDQTNYSNEGGWYECDNIRFRSGYPEKLGGWVKSTPTAFLGVCRQMWNWVTTFSDNLLALGTNEKLYLEIAGNYYNITPLQLTLTSPTTNNSIFVTLGSNVITVTLPSAHGAVTGSYVQISGVVGPILGIPASELNGNFEITVVDAFTFTYVVTTVAGGAATLSLDFITGTYSSETIVGGTGGTAITLEFEIEPGNAITTEGYGWGVGTWGRDTWGLGTTGAPIFLPQRDWWFDNFDNDLVANIRNGPGYWWERGTTDDPTTALATRAITLQAYATANGDDPNAVPVQIMQLLVSQQDRHLIAFGAVPFGSTNVADFDPMLIRWADQDTPSDWTPTTTNTAGDLRVSRGSRIVRAFPARQEVLVFTDTHLFTLQFLGTTDVFGLQEYADSISIMAPRAVIAAANIVYWMGQDKFYVYTGRVETLPCTLRNHVFKDFNYQQAEQVICGTNEQWNEVWWFYPTADSDFNNAYVIFNYLERAWYYGYLPRTAWLDTALRIVPQATNTDLTTGLGYLYSHETGVDADGVAMNSFIRSSDFDLGEGDQFMLTRRIIPDVNFEGSTDSAPEATLSIFPRNFPGTSFKGPSDTGYNPTDNQRVIASATLTQYTPQVFIRARARQMALQVSSNTLGVQWQLGATRLDLRPDGRR